jgi:tetratricopeptide (TPR) repeat protein/tRNA A-37 threonylcarbamoyl transferase component Bud32
LADTRDRLSASLAGRYAVGQELGAGGMATVYLADDLRHQRRVALKVLHPGLAHALGPERFRREIEIAARLQHPAILTVFDSGDADGLLWYTMPFIEGESLRDRLDRDRELPVELALSITREVADALDYAHGEGVVHRDIKPENILLTRGHALVADFGIARALSEESGRLTATGLAIGTPAYMSPEQGDGDRQLDPRSDVYSLATVAYEMLTGEPPYAGATARAVMTKRLTDPVPSPRRLRQTVPLHADQAIVKGLAPAPADRYPTAGDFARALSTLVEAPAPPAPPRRRLGVLIALGLMAGAAVLALVLSNREDPAVEQPSAVELHLAEGNQQLVRRTPEATRLALASYQRALAEDSTNATVLAKLGYTYTLFADWGWEVEGLDAAQVRATALEYSERALRQDSTSAAAWLTRAYLLTVNDPYRLHGAVEAFTRAMALDSTSAEGWYQFGQALMILGRNDEAAAAYRRSFALDPNRPMTLMSLSALSLRAGRLAEARTLIDSAINSSREASSPYVRVVRGMTALAEGDLRTARSNGELARAMDSVFDAPARSLLAMVEAAEGSAAGANAQMDSALRKVGPGSLSPTEVRFLAVALVALRRFDEALALIERVKPRGATLWFYLSSTGFDPIRQDPRFQRIYREADPTTP